MLSAPPSLQSCYEALDAWIGAQALPTILKHWRGRFGTGPQGPQVSLVQYLVDCGLAPTVKIRERLTDFVKSAHATPADILFPKNADSGKRSPENQEAFDQTQRLVPAIARVCLGAVLSRSTEQTHQDDARDHIRKAARLYDEAWPLCDDRWPEEAPDGFQREPESAKLFREACASHANPSQRPLVSTGLILRQLLAVLFQEPDPADQPDTDSGRPFENRLWMLLAGHPQGKVLPVRCLAVDSPVAGFFPDPVAFGITTIDKTMKESFRLAWRCCRPALEGRLPIDNNSSAQGQKRIVRVIPGEIPGYCQMLSGGSAGGLLACGMYAAAQQIPLQTNRTATCSLSLANEAPANGDLASHQILLRAIGGLEQKWQAVHGHKPTFARVVLEKNQAQAWRNQLPTLYGTGASHPDIGEAVTLNDLFEQLQGDTKCENILKTHNNCVAQAWDRRARSVAPNDGAQETDAELNETHRFDCYVQPDYHIERPPVPPNHVQPRSDESDEEKPYTTVEGDGDAQLHQMLRLMFRTDIVQFWHDPPDWLRVAQQKRPRWCVAYDNAGAGKTVFTYRAQHVLTQPDSIQEFFKGRVPLIVRQEGHWPQRNNSYNPLREFLAELIDQQLREAGRPPYQRADTLEAIDYALNQNRVVVILDGFDQFSDEDRQYVVDLLSPKGKNRSTDDHFQAVNHCRWLIAGRAHVIEQHRAAKELFDDDHWVRTRINPFTQDQQDEYFAQTTPGSEPIGKRWLQLIGISESTEKDKQAAIRERMDHLLQLPMTLWYLRYLLETNPANQALPVFKTLSELSLIVGRRMLELAYGRTDVNHLIHPVNGSVLAKPFPRDQRKQLQLLDHVLSLLAFQLMLEQNYDGRVAGNELDDFEIRCRARWLYELDQRAAQPKLPPSQQMAINRELLARDHQWTWAIEVLKAIELNHRSVTETYQASLAFRSRKIVEARAARFLSRYATVHDIWGLGRDHRESTRVDLDNVCAFDFSNDPQWKDCWMLAIEMPRHAGWHRLADGFEDAHLDPVVTGNALSVLFEQPKEKIRPNELVYHAWPLFEFDDHVIAGRIFLPDGRDELCYGAELTAEQRREIGESLLLPGAGAVLKRFRESAHSLLEEIEAHTRDQAQKAKSMSHTNWLKQWQSESSHVKSHTFVQCPPQSWIDEFEKRERTDDPCVNVMGSPLNDSDAVESEFPQHLIRVQPFQTLATSVTRGQYASFDKGRGPQELDDLPVVKVNFYDAFAFSRWLGGRLPSECEQEFLIRGGTHTRYCCGDGTEHLADYAWYGANAGGKAHPVGQKQANDFGVFDGHGNVWEWSSSWWDAEAYVRRILDARCRKPGQRFEQVDEATKKSWLEELLGKQKKPVLSGDRGAAFGSRVCLRGATFNDDEKNVRSASRNLNVPDYRSLNGIGFRVVRVL